MALTDNFLREG